MIIVIKIISISRETPCILTESLKELSDLMTICYLKSVTGVFLDSTGVTEIEKAPTNKYCLQMTSHM